jgi:5,5'-dehydrodivanillate O-demethylase oxygenase subunit
MKQAENEMLTRVGRGTPAGELLRRYWHPVCATAEFTDENPIKRFRLLGEDLVAFRLPLQDGESRYRYGVVAERCSHRLASLAYGRVEADGIRCPYHGWKYGTDGTCLETPPEPKEWAYKNEIRHTSYPTEKLGGLLWTYMGPQPVPLVPRWDVLVREDGKRFIFKESIMDCNWLQAMENSVDPSHLYWLHGYRYGAGTRVRYGSGSRDPLYDRKAQYEEKHEFILFEHGILKRRITSKGKDEHPLLFPNILRNLTGGPRPIGESQEKTFRHDLQIRVPLDDTHTRVYRVNFVPNATDRSPADQDVPFEIRQLKYNQTLSPMELDTPRYDISITGAQDSMAWETQGAITDRAQEHLGHGDRGLVVLRKLLREQIEIVQQGGQPMNVFRDPEKNTRIDLPVINERIGLGRSQAAE